MRALHEQVMEILVCLNHLRVILRTSRLGKRSGNFAHALTLMWLGATGAGSGDKSRNVATEFEQLNLLRHADVCHQDSAPRKDVDQAFAGQPLQCLAYRCTTDVQLHAEFGLRQQGSRCQFTGHDPALELCINPVDDRFDRSRPNGWAQCSHRICDHQRLCVLVSF